MPNKCDKTFSLKDMWSAGFSGFASAGMNWGRQYTTDEWSNYEKISSFLNDKVFSLANIHTTTQWRPHYIRSDDLQFEVIFVQGEVDSEQRAYGIIMNRTWNPRTINDQFWPLYFTQLDKYIFKSFFNDGDNLYGSIYTLADITYGDENQIKLEGFGACKKYNIQYWSWNLGSTNLIDGEPSANTTAEIHSIGGTLKLKQFPTLTWQNPFCVFSIVYQNDCLRLLSIDENSDQISQHVELDNISPLGAFTDSEELPSSVYNKSLNESTPIYYHIYNSFGQIIFEGSTLANLNQELLKFATGVYLVSCIYSDGHYVNHKIVR